MGECSPEKEYIKIVTKRIKFYVTKVLFWVIVSLKTK